MDIESFENRIGETDFSTIYQQDNLEMILGMRGKIEYVKKGKQKKAILVAFPKRNEILIGWSMCHRIEKKFDRDFGLGIAIDRAFVYGEEERSWVVPDSLIDPLINFISRMEKYYKDKRMSNWVNEFTSDVIS